MLSASRASLYVIYRDNNSGNSVATDRASLAHPWTRLIPPGRQRRRQWSWSSARVRSRRVWCRSVVDSAWWRCPAECWDARCRDDAETAPRPTPTHRRPTPCSLLLLLTFHQDVFRPEYYKYKYKYLLTLLRPKGRTTW